MARAVLYGIAVSSGIAIGKAFFLNHRPGAVRHDLVPLSRVENEAARLERATAAVEREFTEARQLLPGELHGQGDILDSHLLICRDPKLCGEALRRIREQRMNAEWALEESVEVLDKAFSKITSPYFRERIQDVRVVAGRIMARLTESNRGNAASSVVDSASPVVSADVSSSASQNANSYPAAQCGQRILLAYDLTPADALGLALDRLLSFATEQGGKTSHTGILARNLEIPALVGVNGLETEVREGDLLIVDGIAGKILVEPTDVDLEAYGLLQGQFEAYQKKIRNNTAAPAETEDGHRVAILANIEKADEASTVLLSGGEGVGLVRTEFGYISRSRLPREDELYEEYSRLVAALAPRRVTFRTLDLGADKMLNAQKSLNEPNPALGLRGIRYCLRHQDMFRRQLRAILRAGAHGDVALMFPLISGIPELRQAKALLQEAIQELEAEGVAFARDIPVGIMIELPSAVFTSGDLAREVDFFSIGTNDLIQYTLGVDRNNRHVAHLHQPLHPAIVRAVKYVVDMAHRAGIPVCVCGEMAADPYCIAILLGMQVDEISIASQSIPGIKHLIRHSNVEECRDLLRRALIAPTVQAINSMARHAAYARFPHDMAFFASQLDI